MPKYTITKYLPLFLAEGGQLMVRLPNGRYVRPSECEIDGLYAFGQPLVQRSEEEPDDAKDAGKTKTEKKKKTAKAADPVKVVTIVVDQPQA